MSKGFARLRSESRLWRCGSPSLGSEEMLPDTTGAPGPARSQDKQKLLLFRGHVSVVGMAMKRVTVMGLRVLPGHLTRWSSVGLRQRVSFFFFYCILSELVLGVYILDIVL